VAPGSAPVVVHAKARDQVLDDGVDYLTATARSVALAAPASVTVTLGPGGFSPSSVNVTPGTGVVFVNASGGTRTLAGSPAPYDWSVTLADGEQHEQFFVAPGGYGVDASPGGAAASVSVSAGSVDTTAGLRAGVGQYRFALPNPLGAGGERIVYELEIDDWPGNRTVLTGGVVGLSGCHLSTYCTSRPSSIAGCTPALSATGSPSASAGSGFVLSAGPVPGSKLGLYIYTTQGEARTPLSLPYGSLCIAASGVHRIAVQSTGGTAGGCDGQLAVDFNQFLATQTSDPSLVVGARVDLQAWYRDPPNPGGADLTQAGSFVICP